MVRFKIVVDADACPVSEIVAHIGEIANVEVLFFCDLYHELQVSYGKVKRIPPGKDAVDFALITALQKGDIVITQDYGVGAMAIGKGAYALHPNGREYTVENIDQMLFERHMCQKIRRSGKRMKGKKVKKRTEEMDAYFELRLKTLIGRMQ